MRENALDVKVLCIQHENYLDQQIQKISPLLDKSSFSKYLFSKAKINPFEKTSFKLTVSDMFLKIKLQ